MIEHSAIIASVEEAAPLPTGRPGAPRSLAARGLITSVKKTPVSGRGFLSRVVLPPIAATMIKYRRGPPPRPKTGAPSRHAGVRITTRHLALKAVTRKT